MIETCEPGMGCGDGACVSACRAAELSKGSMGCEFYAVQPNDAEGSCYAALIANSWDRPATFAGELGGEPIDLSSSIYDVKVDGDGKESYTRLEGPLQPGQVAVVFLSQTEKPTAGVGHVPCPEEVSPALIGPVTKRSTGRVKGFRITSTVPVSAYAIFPYGGAQAHYPTATLLLPTSSWDTGYIAVNPSGITGFPGDPVPNNGLSKPFLLGQRYVQIVASQDDTTVSMRPVTDLASGPGDPGVVAGKVGSWKLSRGEVLQFVQSGELTGSALSSDKPVGLFGGAFCSFVPARWLACDLMQQQIPPLSQWGHEYAVAPYRPRWSLRAADDVHGTRDVAMYTIVSAVDGTKLAYDPEPPAQAPTALAAGQTATFVTDAPFTVRSQDAHHPFFVGSYMPSARYPYGESNSVGDPEFVNVVPANQYLDRYAFFTDSTYAQTTLTIVRRKTAQGFRPITLACAGEISDFRPVGTAGEYEYAWVLLTSAFRPQKFGAGECGYGHHEISSDGPFEVTVWGTGYYASYGFPGGTGLRPLNTVRPDVSVR